MSCSEDPQLVPHDGQMLATVDGQDWHTTTVTASTASVYLGKLMISSVHEDGSELVLVVDSDDKGKFTFSGAAGSANNFAAFRPANFHATTNAIYSSTNMSASEMTGEINITQVDRVNFTLTGSFSFSVKRLLPEEKIIVISGSFAKIPYGNFPANVSEMLSISTINGERFIGLGVEEGAGANGTRDLNLKGSSKSIHVFVQAETNEGTFNFGAAGSEYVGVYDDGSDEFVSESGSVTIITHDKDANHIIGSYTFTNVTTGPDVTVVGSFDIYY